MQQYEYNMSYFPVKYLVHESDLPLVGAKLPFDADPDTFLNNQDYLNHLYMMGGQGWELMSVSPLLRGCYHEGRGYGYSLTAGYFLFWKRPAPFSPSP